MRLPVRWVIVGLAGLLLAAGGTLGRAEEALKGKICYTRKDGDNLSLHVMDADGKNDQALPNQPGKVNMTPAWSPDGKQIAFMSGESEMGDQFGLYVINADGSGLRRLIQDEKMAGLPAWSPDGKMLLCVVDRENSPHLMSLRADGTDARELQVPVKFAIAPFFSPDGKQIVFTGLERENEKKSDLYLANPDGTNAQKLSGVEGLAIAGQGSWSPDGKTIAFVAFDPEAKSGALHTWNVADKVDNSIAPLKVEGNGISSIIIPCWSPDGKWILVNQAGDNGASGLWRISPDGKSQERITPPDAKCFCAAWSRQ
jgi:Tol biopolymer transport system component